MALFLHRIGRAAFRRAWLVIIAWAVALGALLGLGIGLGGQLQESYAIPGTESQDAIDQLAAVFPQTAGASAKAVVEAPDGASVEEAPYRDAIEAMESELGDVDGVASVLGPFDEYAGDQVSGDERSAYIQVQFDGPVTQVTDESIDAVLATGESGRDAGLEVAFGGEVFQETTFGLTVTEAFGVLFAGVVLLITFGSLLAAGMPLLTAILGVAATFGGISLVAAFAPVSSTAPMLAVMIGLAVGIDYALFILSRHRTQLARGMDPEESAAEAVATAGGAVVFAGLTVIIALLGLLVVGIPFLSVMGVAAAFAVLVAVFGATTLLPALLGLAKGRLAPKPGSRAHRRGVAHDEGGRPTLGRRWVDTVLKAPVVFVLLVVGLLGAAAIPAASLDLNLPGGQGEAGSSQREAYDMIAAGFGEGYNGPLIVTVDITQTTDIMDDLDAIAARLADVDGVAYVGDGLPNETVDTAIIQVVPESAPTDPETKQVVQDIRALEDEILADFGTPIAVTGYTAVSIDISQRLTDALVPFALIVVGLSIILLLVVFRSVFVPIKAALGFLLSAFGAIGVTVAVFQWGWLADLMHVEPGPILSFLPILLMAVLFGLAMDYEVFLVSGMREEYVKTRDPRSSIVHGFQHAARVVTAAALIMFFVFFAFVPEGTGVIKGIAFALAIGVAFDAFLVRMTLVPAAMALAGRGAWWLPKWLARILPDVDIEGEGLRAHLAESEWAAERDADVLADDLLVGDPGDPVGPVSIAVPRGGALVVRGRPAERRLLAATLAGRVLPAGGRLAMLGLPLPTDAAAVMQRVAIADAATDGGAAGTAGELVAARVDATRAWYRLGSTRTAVASALRHVAEARTAVADPLAWRTRALDPDTPLASLDPLDRLLVAVAAALAEGPRAIVVDVDAPTGDADRTWRALARLVPAGVVLIATTAPDADLDPARAALDARGIRSLDLVTRPQEALR